MKRLWIVFLFLVLALGARAQDADGVANVVGYMNHAMAFQRAFPQEKVYLHFDNTGYFKGERMWMKAYVVRADNNRPTDISRVLYVDLLSPAGDVVARRKLKIEAGEADGEIVLDSILGTGFYEVRAYTRYMLNFGKETAFSRVFPIFKKPEREGDYSRPTIDTMFFRHHLPVREMEVDSATMLSAADMKKRRGRGYSVNFYPEGGYLVKGLRSKVCFQVLDKNHRPAALAGLVTDSTGQALAVAQSDVDGRGMFELIPQEGMRLVLTLEKGKTCEFDIDDVLSEGCALRVDAVTGDDVVAQLFCSPEMAGQLLGYTVMNCGNIVHADTLKAEPLIELSLERSGLRPGVNQLTVFDGEGRIRAERLFFVCPKEGAQAAVGLKAKTQELEMCGKVSVELQTQPGAHLSFAAVDAGTMANGAYGSIGAYMLLGSDVRGYIPHPEYYFEADDEEHRRSADSLMLFNGWRRYNWQVMADVEPWQGRIQQVEDKLYVFGQLRRAYSKWIKNNPVGGVDLTAYLYNAKGEHLVGQTRTDSLGNYAFELPDLEGEWKMFIETRIDNKKKTYTITIDRQFTPEARYLAKAETEMQPLDEGGNLFVRPSAALLAERDKDEDEPLRRQVGEHEFVTKTVKVKAKKHYWTDYTGGWYNEHNGYIHANIYYDCDVASDAVADQGEVQPTVESWLVRQNSLFNFRNRGNTESVEEYDGRPIVWILNNKFYNITGDYSSGNEPIVVGWRNLEPWPSDISDVKSIYVVVDNPLVANNYVVGVEGKQPVIVFVYTHPYVSTASKKGNRKTYFQGFNVAEKFEMEDYSVVPPLPDDYRRTLFWQPNVVADEQGRATVEFYNNSTCTDIRVSAEGMTQDGRFVSTE